MIPLREVVMMCLCAVALTMAMGAAPAAGSDLPGLHVGKLPDGMTLEVDVQAVLDGTLDASFQPVPSTRLSPSRTQQRWFRLHLDDDWQLPDRPVLSVREAEFMKMWVYAPPDYRGQQLRHDQSMGGGTFAHRALAMHLPRTLARDDPVYVRTAPDSGAQHATARIHSAPDYAAQDLAHVRLVTLLISVQLTMVIVGFALWLALRDRVFGWFVAYASVQLLYVMIVTGEIYTWPGGSLLALHGNRPVWFTAAASGALALSFIIEFCSLRTVTPRMARALDMLRWPFVLLAVGALLPSAGLVYFARPALNITLLVASITAIAAVLMALRRGDRAARFFVVAWMPQVAFTALRVTQILMELPHPTWLQYGFPLSMSFATVIILLGLADAILHVRRERDLAHEAAERDGLTGVLNRDGLMRRLDEACAQTRESARPLALLFIDLDHFKAINDCHGHQVGDLCLQAVAQAAQTLLGQHRIFGRYGGEEFLAILPDTTPAQARVLGEQLRAHIAALSISSRPMKAPLRLTASIGISHWLAPDDSPKRLIQRADLALYDAKAGGRNCIVAHASAVLIPSL